MVSAVLLHRLVSEAAAIVIDPMRLSAPLPDCRAVDLVPSGMKREAHLMPLCVRPCDLDASGREALVGWIEAVVCHRDDPPALLIVDAAESTERVLSHLRRRLIIRLADGQQCIFRYFDPMVLKHLEWMLDTSQRAALLGPGTSWCYWLDGQWRRLNQVTPSASTDFQVDALLSARLGRVAALNGVVATQSGVTTAATRIELYREIDSYIARAQAKGLPREQDWEAFARLCLSCHPRFDEHPLVIELFGQALDDESEFKDLVCAEGEEFWASVSSDMALENANCRSATT